MSEQIYEVEDIVDHRVRSGRYEYKIKWKGYGLGDCTWQPQANLSECPELLKKYKIKKGIIKQEKKIGNIQKNNKKASDDEEDYDQDLNGNQEEQDVQVDIVRGKSRGRGQNRIKKIIRQTSKMNIAQQQPQNNVQTIQEEQNECEEGKMDIMKMLKDQKGNIFFKCRKGNVISNISRSQMVKSDLLNLMAFYEKNMKIRQAMN